MAIDSSSDVTVRNGPVKMVQVSDTYICSAQCRPCNKIDLEGLQDRSWRVRIDPAKISKLKNVQYRSWVLNIDLEDLGQGSYLTTFGIWWIGFILKITKKGPGGQVKHAALICAYIQYRSWVLKIDPEGLQDRFWVLQDVSWLKGTIWKMVNIDLEYSISILKTLRIDPAEQDLSG